MSVWVGELPHGFSLWRVPRLRTPARLLGLYGFIVILSVLLAPSAHAATLRADSDAPPGAGALWLPSEEWVMERWLPFDEARLEAILDLEESSVHAYVLRTGRTLNQLAKRQGVPTQGLAKRLVAPRGKVTSRAQRAILRRRTTRVLTQSHLSEHMLDHHFHTWSVLRHPEGIFGVTQARFHELADQGRSLGEVAADGGVAAHELRRRMIQAVGNSGKRGVTLVAMTKRQNRRLRARGRAHDFDWILNYRLPVEQRGHSTRSSAVGAQPETKSKLCRIRRPS